VQDSRSEQELVAAANRGEAGAMEEIYRRHRDWALRVAWRFTRDRDMAMDAAQEAFIYLFSKFGRGGGLELRAKLTTLMYSAVKNCALAAQRKKRPGRLGEPCDPPDEHGREGPIERGERSAEVMAMLAMLSEGHREVVLMKIVDGMEHAEIALALGIPEGTVKSRLHHALAALRERAAEAADERPIEPNRVNVRGGERT
jgi:RNA polymerase sigma-70 factor, ECF subfamily